MTFLNADKWLYSQLKNDATLKAVVSSRVYADAAPQKTSYPFITFSQVSTRSVTNFSKDRVMDEELWQVVIWTNLPSYSSLETLADRVRELLHKSSGSGVLSAVFERMQRLEEREGDQIYKALLLEFRIFTQ